MVLEKEIDMSLENELLQVRKAYRLLYDYQSRILDLVSFCGSRMGFKYLGGYPKFSDASPRKGKGTLDSWSWDWLNMYFYQFKFEEQVFFNDNDKNEVIEYKLQLSIFIVSDDGYFNEKSKAKSRLDIENFASVESSKTKIIFLIGKNGWKTLWDSGDWSSREFICGETNLKDDKDTIMFKQVYSLNDFINEQTTMATLKRFQEECKNNNIILNIYKSKLQ